MAWGLRSNWCFFHQRKNFIFFIDLKIQHEESRAYVNHKFILDKALRNCAQVCPATARGALFKGVSQVKRAL
jgi:hypothetical protein